MPSKWHTPQASIELAKPEIGQPSNVLICGPLDIEGSIQSLGDLLLGMVWKFERPIFVHDFNMNID